MSQDGQAVPHGQNALVRMMPIFDWLPHYTKAWLTPDLLAGLSVWALVVPQALAYAAVVGVHSKTKGHAPDSRDPRTAKPRYASSSARWTALAMTGGSPHWQRFLPGEHVLAHLLRQASGGRGRQRAAEGRLRQHPAQVLPRLRARKMTLLLAFTLAGYNLEAIRSFTAKKEAERVTAPPKRTRKRRRKGTWADVIGPDQSISSPSGSGRSPPPT